MRPTLPGIPRNGPGLAKLKKRKINLKWPTFLPFADQFEAILRPFTVSWAPGVHILTLNNLEKKTNNTNLKKNLVKSIFHKSKITNIIMAWGIIQLLGTSPGLKKR